MSEFRFFRKNTGVGLIEVLIAILIFGFGILGVMGLQLASLKYQKSAWSRAGATTGIVDIGERIHSNSVAAREDLYTYAGTVLGTPPACAPECTPEQLAQRDIFEWNASISSKLPSGKGLLSGSGNTGIIATVTWFDKEAIDSKGAAIANTTCATVSGAGPIDASKITATCCPEGLRVGTRCVNSVILP